MKVYLDDMRDAPEGWVRTHTVKETINYLRSGQVDELSLDHDLGLVDSYTGYDVLVWLEHLLHTNYEAAKKIMPQVILIHTQNPVGERRMKQVVAKIYEKLHG